jgi:protease I
MVALGRHNGEAIMTKVLEGKRIAILATNGVEESELVEPRKALDKAGAKTELISPASGKIQAMNHKAQGDTFEVDLPLDEANAEDYDALLLPGGVANPDELRTEAKAVDLVRAIFEQGKPIAAICHGPWMLIEADVVGGHTVTSWPSLKTDLNNAGATWTDSEVVQDGQFTTSRKPDDLPTFVREMLRSFSAVTEPRTREHRNGNG